MSLSDFLAQFSSDFSRRARVELFAYYLRHFDGRTEFSAADIRRCFTEAFLPAPTDLTALLKSLAKGKQAPLLRIKDNLYAISVYGVNDVEAILPLKPQSVVGTSLLKTVLPSLQLILTKVSDPLRRDFLAEAISCLEVGARRATVVLAWIAALDHMYDYVLAHGLAKFNAALAKQQGKIGNLRVVNKDDFGDLKESEFIIVSRSAKLITNDVRKILDEKLGFRNSCAHPSSIAVGDYKVLSFVEDLVDNVIAKHTI
jgi:hypothetical protein